MSFLQKIIFALKETKIELNLNQSLFAQVEILLRQREEFFLPGTRAMRWSSMSYLTIADYVDNWNHARNIHETKRISLNDDRVENRDYSTPITPTRSNFAFIIFIILFIKSKINSHKNLWLLHVTSCTSLLYPLIFFSLPQPFMVQTKNSICPELQLNFLFYFVSFYF